MWREMVAAAIMAAWCASCSSVDEGQSHSLRLWPMGTGTCTLERWGSLAKHNPTVIKVIPGVTRDECAQWAKRHSCRDDRHPPCLWIVVGFD